MIQIISGDFKGKGKRVLKIVGTVTILTIMISFGNVVALAEGVNSLNPLYETLPAARFNEVANWERIRTPDLPLARTEGVFKGESEQGQWIGTVVHLVTPGYGGPMGVLVAFDLKGNIVKVNVFRHHETECHITGMTNGKFLEQFIGVSLLDKLKLLVGLYPAGKGDIQAMTGGTVTSRAVSEAVSEARKVFYGLYFDNNQSNVSREQF